MYSVFSLGPFSIAAPHAFNKRFFFDVVTQMIDVVTNSAQTTPTYYALNFSWGEPWYSAIIIIHVILIYSLATLIPTVSLYRRAGKFALCCNVTALVVGAAKLSCILGALCLPIIVVAIVALVGVAIGSATISEDAFLETILGYFDNLQALL